MSINHFTRRISVLLAAALAAMSIEELSAQTDPAAGEIKPIKVSRLIGMKVENRDGVEFGKLRDLAVDARTGRVKYAVVASGGFLGIQVKLRAVPPHLLSAATAKRDTLSLNLALAKWNDAPTFHLSELPGLGHSARAESINRFYQQAMKDKRSFTSQESRASTNVPLMQTGRGDGEHSPTNRSHGLRLAGELIGTSLQDRNHERLGDILDVLVALDERIPAFAVVSASRLFKGHERHYLVTLRALSIGSRGKGTLDVDRDAFQRAPKFSGRMTAASVGRGGLEIFRYHDDQ